MGRQQEQAFFLRIWSLLWVLFLPVQVAQAEDEYRFERMWPVLEQPWYFGWVRSGIAVGSDGTVNIVDSQYHRVQQFTEDGRFMRSWGNTTSAVGEQAAGQFSSPQDVSLGLDGSIYILDSGNLRVQHFSPNGEYLRSWGREGVGEGEFARGVPTEYLYGELDYERFWETFGPNAIAIAPDGIVVIADTWNHRIQQFTPEGVFIRAWGKQGSGHGEFIKPAGLAIGADGAIYVSDTFNHRIQQFTAEGQFVRSWGTEGNGNDQLRYPFGLAVDHDGTVYVADMVNNRVQHFSAVGDYLNGWSDRGINGGLYQPFDIALGSDSRIYVREGSGIGIYESNGSFVDMWTSSNILGSSNDDNKLNWPWDLSFTKNGNLLINESGRINEFTINGSILGGFWHDGWAEAFAIADSGDVYLTTSQGYVYYYSSEGDLVHKWGGPGSENGKIGIDMDPARRHATGIAVAQDGTVLVSDAINNRIQRFTADGQFILAWGSEGHDDGQFNLPNHIEMTAENTLLVVDSGNRRVQEFDLDGQFIRSWGDVETAGSGSALEHPYGIAVGPDGTIFVRDIGSRLEIKYFSRSGEFLGRFGEFGTGPGQISNYEANLAVAPNGDVYVPDTYNSRILVFSKKDETSRSTAHPHKAIVLAGGGAQPSNTIWDATQLLANMAYNALRLQGFAKDEVKYLSPVTNMDLDNNGLLDDLELATLAKLEASITDWAGDAEDVVIYLVDHGGPERFRVNETEILTADSLAKWVAQLEERIPGRVVLVIEACESGSFLPALAAFPNDERIVMTSTAADEVAYILNRGLISFSYYFWGGVHQGADLEQCFVRARNGTSPFQEAGRPQYPQLDSDSDGETTVADLARIEGQCLGNCVKYASDPPQIVGLPSGRDLMGETSAALWVQISSLQPIINAWAVVERPDFIHGDSAQPIDEAPKVTLQCDDAGYCSGEYEQFDVKGDYRLSFYAEDRKLQLTLPMTATFRQTVGAEPAASVFDTDSGSLRLSAVTAGGDSFYVELTHRGSLLFELAHLAPNDSAGASGANYEIGSGTLHLPRVYVEGDFYDATLQHQGDWLFSVTAAYPVQ
jgi:DNA-binding beta-propeller fold protein YncE